ncbi:hypothetical protein PoB_006206600 [Plakobranchus ocellatus]|uniref:Uncharacterized protein n=1 Tax=Plakobranchus ocellatus TaxID=259542 RepID=A0AAV4CUH3_9GAST|nr:hypothetical protein PoB_006206600 [Plakobranchus ocellatus]
MISDFLATVSPGNGPQSSQGAGDANRNCDRKVPSDGGADSLFTAPPRPRLVMLIVRNRSRAKARAKDSTEFRTIDTAMDCCRAKQWTIAMTLGSHPGQGQSQGWLKVMLVLFVEAGH